jgi:hypothetical protein
LGFWYNLFCRLYIDSTGLKVYGEGGWKVRKHGWSKHRTWRKLNVCVDLVSQEILSVELTGNDDDDASVVAVMLKGKTGKLGSFKGDGAYDKFGFREFLGDIANSSQKLIPKKFQKADTAYIFVFF